MKTPLPSDEEMLPALLARGWGVVVAIRPLFIPIGDSAYSYRVEAVTGEPYYLKVVDRRTAVARQMAARMRKFSLPLQRHVAELELQEMGAPVPQPTRWGSLAQEYGRLFLALYSFIEGETLSNRYPMSAALVGRIGRALGRLHTVQVPGHVRRNTAVDTHLIAFDERLRADLEAISSISVQALIWKQQLRELVAPRLEMIRGFMAKAEQYAERVQQVPQQVVVCHGDPWGGNVIPAGDGRLIFLDWESAVMAPAERDAFVYLSDPSRPEFWAFVQGYQQTRGEPVQWQPLRLAYHAYRQQLRNLAHWLHKLLHERLDEEQRANDLEMIGFHCLDRWEGIEQATTRLVQHYATFSGILR
jgi:aminoglycoside phosphotransferase (APT) family kinase protein